MTSVLVSVLGLVLTLVFGFWVGLNNILVLVLVLVFGLLPVSVHSQRQKKNIAAGGEDSKELPYKLKVLLSIKIPK